MSRHSPGLVCSFGSQSDWAKPWSDFVNRKFGGEVSKVITDLMHCHTQHVMHLHKGSMMISSENRGLLT